MEILPGASLLKYGPANSVSDPAESSWEVGLITCRRVWLIIANLCGYMQLHPAYNLMSKQNDTY